MTPRSRLLMMPKAASSAPSGSAMPPWARAAALARAMREPLAGLRGYLEALEDGVFPSDAVIQARLQEELQRLQRLAEELESLSQVQNDATSSGQ